MSNVLDLHCRPFDGVPLTKLDLPAPSVEQFRGEDMLLVAEDTLSQLAKRAFHDMNFFVRDGHLSLLADILKDNEASPNDKYVALELLKNYNIASGGIFPMCQDTGTAIVIGNKGRRIMTTGNKFGGDDREAVAKGIFDCYQEYNLRYSQMSPLQSFKEVNTKNNLPAQIEIAADGPAGNYEFLFIAKGGGSANKTFFYQPPPSLLDEEKLLAFITAKLRELGTSACPPYHLAVVIGGTSAEMAVKAVKLASCRYLDNLPTHGGDDARPFRDKDLEEKVFKITQGLGIGAQFGGKYFCVEARVIRLPRHGASLPIALAVSCSADRQALARIDRDGVWLEELCKDPAKFLPHVDENKLLDRAVEINLNQPMEKILSDLRQCSVKTRVSLSGTIVVARDLAHQKLLARLKETGKLPDYLKDHPIYYAGPAKTPEGFASGSFGPTTAGRMDGYVEEFQKHGASLVMLAKGNRSKVVAQACKKYGGFYLGSIGGPAAKLGRDCITKVEVIDYEEFGMEAVRKITVKNLPAFVVIDHQGHDFYDGLTTE
ncbi:MAG: FumA C-terminus/TtdB family hydratase beta subunit [Hydrotalea sp.]|nr:FumA C-terminus/TtdB family hydratase beta subunit [Hydrotalea sp.]